MKYFFLLVYLNMSQYIFSQELNIFPIDQHGFVSLSEIDNWHNVEYSTILPIMENNDDDVSLVEKADMVLSSKYRNNFLSRTGIKESDSMYIYSYLKDELFVLPIDSLKAIALLTYYISPDECPCDLAYYQLGFAVNTAWLNQFEKSYTHTLIAIGNQNPFVRKKMHNIKWSEIPPDSFPSEFSKEKVLSSYYSRVDTTYNLGATYFYESDSDSFEFYTQQLLKNEYHFGLRLLVIDKSRQTNRFERIMYAGESASFASLNSQWTGLLFRDRPPVIFGFQSHAYGCSGVDFIHPSMKRIIYKCDNRH